MVSIEVDGEKGKLDGNTNRIDDSYHAVEACSRR